MPYIKKDRRRELVIFSDPSRVKLFRVPGATQTPGELNFQITDLILNYVDIKGLSYQTINDIVGALESCKLEFYRRMVVPYEEEKIKENGDVY